MNQFLFDKERVCKALSDLLSDQYGRNLVVTLEKIDEIPPADEQPDGMQDKVSSA